MKKNYQVILFDLDGTLTDPQEGITKSIQYALKCCGYGEINTKELIPFIGPPLKASFKSFYQMDEKMADQALLKFRERFSDVGWSENRLYKGIDVLLRDLKEAGKIIALATSKPLYYAKKILDYFEITPYFDVIMGSEMDGTREAKWEVIEAVLEQLKEKDYSINDMVMVGDRKYDVEGAKHFNMECIGLLMGYGDQKELEEAGATYLVKDINELRLFLL